MNNLELDGIPLSVYEIEMIRNERSRVTFIKKKEIKLKECVHSFTIYLGHGHNDEAYECRYYGKIKYV